MSKFSYGLGFALSLWCGAAEAQVDTCLTQEMSAQKVQHDADGKTSTRPVDLSAVRPGDELVYTILVRNICDKAVNDIMIDKAVPDHRRYLKTSAKGYGTDRVFSVDGRGYDHWDALRVRGADGSSRPVEMDDIKSIRWIFNGSMSPGDTAVLHFHAIAK